MPNKTSAGRTRRGSPWQHGQTRQRAAMPRDTTSTSTCGQQRLGPAFISREQQECEHATNVPTQKWHWRSGAAAASWRTFSASRGQTGAPGSTAEWKSLGVQPPAEGAQKAQEQRWIPRPGDHRQHQEETEIGEGVSVMFQADGNRSWRQREYGGHTWTAPRAPIPRQWWESTHRGAPHRPLKTTSTYQERR